MAAVPVVLPRGVPPALGPRGAVDRRRFASIVYLERKHFRAADLDMDLMEEEMDLMRLEDFEFDLLLPPPPIREQPTLRRVSLSEAFGGQRLVWGVQGHMQPQKVVVPQVPPPPMVPTKPASATDAAA